MSIQISQVLMKAKETEHLKGILRNPKGYCALGKLICAANRGDEIINQRRLVKVENEVLLETYSINNIELGVKRFICPRCAALESEDFKFTLKDFIMHLNDFHYGRYSFEDIGRILRSYGL